MKDLSSSIRAFMFTSSSKANPVRSSRPLVAEAKIQNTYFSLIILVGLAVRLYDFLVASKPTAIKI